MVLAASSVAQASVFQAGGDRLIDMQQDDSGWDWPLNDGDLYDLSATNTAGPIAMGLLASYQQTGDITHLAAATAAGDFIKAVSPPHSTGNGIFMHALSAATGDASYANDVKAEYYDALRDDAYVRNGITYDTAGFGQFLLDVRGNLAPWDIGLAAVGAARLGSAQAELDVWGDKLEAGLNSWEGDYSTEASSYSVLGLAGGIFGLAALGQDLDNAISSGNYLDGAQTPEDLAGILATYQASQGGFGYYADYPLDDYTCVQATAYAILALNEVDPVTYADEISLAGNWLAGVQLTSGGWGGTWAGTGSENNELTGEALWALDVAVPEPSSIIIWGLLGVGCACGTMDRRRRRRAS